jgi:very-short-patch-repair endonuclease
MPQFRPRATKRAQQLRNSATEPERRLWRHLSRRQLEGYKFSRQMPVGPFICDFMCRERQLIIELDGGQHADSTRDASRTAFLEAEGYRVVRFWNNDVLSNTQGVLQVIAEALKV